MQEMEPKRNSEYQNPILREYQNPILLRSYNKDFSYSAAMLPTVLPICSLKKRKVGLTNEN
jgi:hypothetical protein